MAGTLVIVESPAKAKTIGKYLGRDYTVRATMGHVRDLPPERLGVNVEDGSFLPEYESVKGRGKIIGEIRTLAKEASAVLLATDPDREGEAIAWHIASAAGLNRRGLKVSRVEFHEITERAIKQAVANPRQLDMNLVNAQQARRVLDRLVGYRLSPLLWKKVQRGLSAGRVQSVALRVVVDREQEIEAFVPREFWTVEADLARSPWSKQKNDLFRAVLFTREKSPRKWEFEKGEEAQQVVKELEAASWKVAAITRKEKRQHPSAPFTTSTLQQEAARKLGFAAKHTMKVAQELYEGVSLGSEGNSGLITYMRTDSVNVSREAQEAARAVIVQQFSPEYLPSKPPFYKSKALNAQEAHEAIRPTNPARLPDGIRQFLGADQHRLYRLIWQRFIASQMAEARLEVTTYDIDAQPRERTKQPYLFRASGERTIFPGFMAIYRESVGDSEDSEEIKGLPRLQENDALDPVKLLPEQHFTQPPPRFGEATLVKTLEELGVGRPSTYATILSTIQDRGYVVVQGVGREKKFVPTPLGSAVTTLLVARFPDLLDVKFTAKLEDELDQVAEGKREWVPLVAEVYHPMMQHLALAEREVAKIEVAQSPDFPVAEKRKTTGRSSYTRKSGSSSYAAKTPRTRKTAEKKADYATPNGEPSGEKVAVKRAPRQKAVVAEEAQVTCDKCGKPMVKRKGPYSEFYGCSGYPTCRNIRKL
ncbi:MAG: type I DNA topoisomerase [Chloroflexi bacterium]|uniref:DNA topoisomerase 1 n=1 Tax=Candidatus Chlorohelix allophototropha TaxID=3003348 RepID=A0A8T7M9P7_9CHLR|nr:type I DNA topoisomerase [Chloroflexota bacterium]WJW68792.1 type I DNA topoisomerase [Chloroflexota bacterium L227-S17]